MKGNNRKLILVFAILVIAGIFAVFLTKQFVGGTAQPITASPCPVTPPPSTARLDLTNAMNLAAQLGKAGKEAKSEKKVDMEIVFRTVAQTGFATISDKNTTLLILINGANCLLERGDIGKPASDKLIDAAYKLVLAEYGLAGGTAVRIVTEDDRQALLQGKGTEEIFQLLKAAGYKLAWEKSQ